MDTSDRARELLVEKLEEIDWDISEEGLEGVARELQTLFPTYEQAKEFVEANASSLYDMMQEIARSRYDKPPKL
jgi:hypothetical protein